MGIKNTELLPAVANLRLAQSAVTYIDLLKLSNDAFLSGFLDVINSLVIIQINDNGPIKARIEVNLRRSLVLIFTELLD